MQWFPDVSGAELRPHLAGGLVEPQLMTGCPALCDPAFGRGAGWNVTLWLVGGVKGSLRMVTARYDGWSSVVVLPRHQQCGDGVQRPKRR